MVAVRVPWWGWWPKLTEPPLASPFLGMVTYRTREEFNQRFSWDAAGPYHLGDAINFEVESYLQNKGSPYCTRVAVVGVIPPLVRRMWY